jgi:large subunit ribosomal protein L21
MLYAILESGGKQYKAIEGESIAVDLLPEEVGKKKTFDKVLLLSSDTDTQVGSPYLDGVSVDCTITEHFKGEKVTIFKYRAKQRFRVKTGHRQSYSRVVVNSIAFPGKTQTSPKSTAKEEQSGESVKKGRSKPSASAKKPAAKKPAAAKTDSVKKTTSTRKKSS